MPEIVTAQHSLQIWNSSHIYSNSYILLNSCSNDFSTVTELPRSKWTNPIEKKEGKDILRGPCVAFFHYHQENFRPCHLGPHVSRFTSNTLIASRARNRCHHKLYIYVHSRRNNRSFMLPSHYMYVIHIIGWVVFYCDTVWLLSPLVWPVESFIVFISHRDFQSWLLLCFIEEDWRCLMLQNHFWDRFKIDVCWVFQWGAYQSKSWAQWDEDKRCDK